MPIRKVQDGVRRRCPMACKSCQRRKEGCDSMQPCSRCVIRGVGAECSFSKFPSPIAQRPRSDATRNENIVVTTSSGTSVDSSTHQLPLSSHLTPVPQLSRLVSDARGQLTFVGNAANLSFLHILRRLVAESLGECAFLEETAGKETAEDTPDYVTNWIVDAVRNPPSKPNQVETGYLLRWYRRATKSIFNLFDEFELEDKISYWLQGTDTCLERAIAAIAYLVLAIGAQTCPEDRDAIAERYFNYGRFLTASTLIEEPSIWAVHAHVLIAMYLLGASRQNGAFMVLGAGVRAALALGVHRSDINAAFHGREFAIRERTWTILRNLDIFTCASLGRPPSTFEIRKTQDDTHYSAINDLSSIFEDILTQVYSQNAVPIEVPKRISKRLRQWATKFTSRLIIDTIRPDEYIESANGRTEPNLGLFHLKEAYYWTIMLLARPFLIEFVTSHVSRPASHTFDRHAAEDLPFHQALAYACVDSATRTVDLLSGLLSKEELPKRLPFVVNSLFIAGLVLGLAHFGDLDGVFPLDKGLMTAEQLLSLFATYDAVARIDLAILQSLRTACSFYIKKRNRDQCEQHREFIGSLFGNVNGNDEVQDHCAKQPEALQPHRNSWPLEFDFMLDPN